MRMHKEKMGWLTVSLWAVALQLVMVGAECPRECICQGLSIDCSYRGLLAVPSGIPPVTERLWVFVYIVCFHWSSRNTGWSHWVIYFFVQFLLFRARFSKPKDCTMEKNLMWIQNSVIFYLSEITYCCISHSLKVFKIITFFPSSLLYSLIPFTFFLWKLIFSCNCLGGMLEKPDFTTCQILISVSHIV